MTNEATGVEGTEQRTPLNIYRNAILDRIAQLEAVVSDQFEVAAIFPLQLGASQSMRVHTIGTVEPDLLIFNGLLDNHTPATLLIPMTRLELALVTRKRFAPGQKAMTAFGFTNEAGNDWS